MSAEILMNFDKSISKKTNSDGLLIKTSSNEKKEGKSLFDSIMNEVKSDHKSSANSEKSNENNSQQTTVSKNDSLSQKETIIDEKKVPNNSQVINNSLNQKETIIEGKKVHNNPKIINEALTEKETIKDKKIESADLKTTENVETIKKMVDKLVGSVVSEAKKNHLTEPEVKNENTINKKELETKVEKIVESKINNIDNKDELKNVIDKKLDIVKSSVNKIEKEAKIIINSDDEKSNDKIKDSKNIIKNEVNIIKDNVKEIKKEILSVSSDDEKSNDKIKDSKNIIKNEINIIKDNVKEIKKEISPINNVDVKEIKIEISPVNNDDVKEIKKEISPVNNDDVKEIKKEISPVNNDDVKEIKKEISSVSKNDVINSSNEDTELKESNTLSKNLINTIEDNLSIIDESSDEIKTAVIKTDANLKIENKIEVIKEAVNDIKEKVFETIIVKTTGSEVKQLDTLSTSASLLDTNNNDTSNQPLLATMFLNSQNSMKKTTSLSQVHDAKTNIIEKRSLESVKDSSNKLDLNIEETEVEHLEEKGKKPVSKEKNEEFKSNNLLNNRVLNRVLIDQKVNATNLTPKSTDVPIKDALSTFEAEQKNNIETIEMSVPKDALSSLQNKIIGAQQKTGSFMSDIAKNMYLNYKPPVTAFRVNLNPANLGSISILMKANKVDNSLSVSMNVSNSNTMESFTENKVLLQNAIQKQFSDTSEVSISFNMQDQTSENTFNDFNSNQNQEQNQEQDKNKENNSELEEAKDLIENNDYM